MMSLSPSLKVGFMESPETVVYLKVRLRKIAIAKTITAFIKPSITKLPFDLVFLIAIFYTFDFLEFSIENDTPCIYYFLQFLGIIGVYSVEPQYNLSDYRFNLYCSYLS